MTDNFLKEQTMRRLLLILSLILIPAVSTRAADLILPSNPNGNYNNAGGNIVSQGTCTVQSGANVQCRTTYEITLNPGFETMANGAFFAEIDASDTDADGLPDWWEIAYFGNLSKGANDDPDNDQLTNLQEFTYHANPTLFDTDNDTLPDGWEIAYFSNFNQGPGNDPDGDGLTNYQEYLIHSNPTVFNKDNDNDGLEDWWELLYFGNLSQTANADPDGDQLTNLQEFLLGTNPTIRNNPDSDGDGLLDWWELQYFGTLQYGRNDDPDGDGFSNYLEWLAKTNPNDAGSKPKPGSYYEYDAIGRIKKIYKVK